MNSNRLYTLLPEVFRQADIGQGLPLLALTEVLGSVDDHLYDGIDALYGDWFVETCPLETLPLIAALVGLDLPTPLRPEHRALVADTLAVRRRRGIAAALPVLLRGASDWYTLPLDGTEVPPGAWPLKDDGSDPYAGEGWSIPPLDGSDPVQLWVWRLPVFALGNVTAAPVSTPSGWPSTWFGLFRRNRMNPLGLAQTFWNLASAPLSIGPPPVPALPVQVTPDMLDEDLARYRRDWPLSLTGTPAGVPADSLLYGPERGLLLSIQTAINGPWTPVPPYGLRPASLTGADPLDLPPPDYPVFVSGTIDNGAIVAGSYPYKVTLGDTIAQIAVSLPDKPQPDQCASALMAALAGAQITQPGSHADALAKSLVLPNGHRLVVLPTIDAHANYTFGIVDQSHKQDPLNLIHEPTALLAVRTVPIDSTLIAQMYGATPGQGLWFCDASGLIYSVPLPPDSNPSPTVASIAASWQAVLYGSTVLAQGQRIVVVPDFASQSQSPPAVLPVPPNRTGPAIVAWDLGLLRAALFDPSTGTVAWPAAGTAPKGVMAGFGYAAAMGIGGGSYRSPPPVPPAGTTLYTVTPTGSTGINATLSSWSNAHPVSAVFQLVGSANFSLTVPPPPQPESEGDPPPPIPAMISLGAGQALAIQAQDQQRPMLIVNSGPLPLGGPPSTSGAAGTLTFDGLLVKGGLAATAGKLSLKVTDCTLYATGSDKAFGVTQRPSSPSFDVSVERSILGPVDGTKLAGSLTLTDSILSLLPTVNVDGAVLPSGGASLATTFLRSTLLGTAATASALKATDTLFVGQLTATGACTFDHCFVGDLWVPLALHGDPTPPTGLPPPGPDGRPQGGTVVRCTVCDGIVSLRLWCCYIKALSLDPATIARCTCATPAPGAPRDCQSCAVPGCADTCPLKAEGQEWEPLGKPPDFYPDNAYPGADFARLTLNNPPQILRGATDRGQIGAFNQAQTAVRGEQFARALKSALMYGAGADVSYRS